MSDEFFKFPSTPHLATLPGVDVRGDKVLSVIEREDFLQHEVVGEEKIDGANLGISFDSEGKIRVQNRGSYLTLPGSGQWKKLGDWLVPRMDILLEHLAGDCLLFGEWCYAQHSVFYNRLPDWFLGFDIYDKRCGRFLAVEHRNVLLKKMGVTPVPQLVRGHFTYPETQKLLSRSQFSDQPAEGIYFRLDQAGWLLQRAKLVRPSFVQAMEQHWSRSAIRPNQINPVLQPDAAEMG